MPFFEMARRWLVCCINRLNPPPKAPPLRSSTRRSLEVLTDFSLSQHGWARVKGTVQTGLVQTDTFPRNPVYSESDESLRIAISWK